MLVHKNIGALNLLECRLARTALIYEVCAAVHWEEMQRVVKPPVVRQEDIPGKSFSNFVLAHVSATPLPW